MYLKGGWGGGIIYSSDAQLNFQNLYSSLQGHTILQKSLYYNLLLKKHYLGAFKHDQCYFCGNGDIFCAGINDEMERTKEQYLFSTECINATLLAYEYMCNYMCNHLYSV